MFGVVGTVFIHAMFWVGMALGFIVSIDILSCYYHGSTYQSWKGDRERVFAVAFFLVLTSAVARYLGY